jgi:hypothetical protein
LCIASKRWWRQLQILIGVIYTMDISRIIPNLVLSSTIIENSTVPRALIK